MPGGARRSLASPVVSGVLCQCGGVGVGGVPGPVPAPPAGPPSAAEGSPADPERRLRSLFLLLDVNRDGALCVHDLAVGLRRLGLHRSERDLRRSAASVCGTRGVPESCCGSRYS